MLNQHENLVEPVTDYLRVGECVVDVARRDVHPPGGGDTRRITLKSLQVLLMLVAHQGKVVSRVAILEWVWAETLPSDDVLTQAIAQLRKAFGDDRETPRYLETIAKNGYRLLAPVEWVTSLQDATGARAGNGHAWVQVPDVAVVEAAAVAADAQAHAPAASRMPPLIAWVALLLVGIAVMVVAALRVPHRPDPVAAKPPAPAIPAKPVDFQRITSMPGSEEWPSLSPDGSQVVYAAYPEGGASSSLYMQTTAPVPARAITATTPGTWDAIPAWSPTGRDIAFARTGSGERCSIMLIPATGGEPREISPCLWKMDGSIAWHPDGRHLVTTLAQADSDASGVIHTIDLNDGRWTRLAYDRGKNDYDGLATYSPDGKWIAFRRNLSVADIWRVPATGGTPERLTSLKTNINAIAWTPDGRSIVFGRYIDGGISIARLDLATRKVEDLGLRNGGLPSIAAHADAMAFVVGQGSVHIFSMDLGTPDPSKTASQLFASTGTDLLPSVSPDGKQLAFVSDRSGTIAVWWAEVGRPESLRMIDGVLPVPRYAPVWSTDSSRMLMIGRSEDDYGVYEIATPAGTVRRLPVPDKAPVYAEYMPQASRLLVVADGGSGRLGLNLYDTSATPWRSIAHLDDVALTRVDAVRQRILFTRPLAPGLWETGYDLSSPRQLSERPGVGGGRRLLVDDGGIWLAVVEGEKCALLWMRLPESKDHPGKCLMPGSKSIGMTSVSRDRAGNKLYYSLQQGMNDDIAFMRALPR